MGIYKSGSPIRFAEAFAMTGVRVGSGNNFAAVTWLFLLTNDLDGCGPDIKYNHFERIRARRFRC
jgi:hypothetical protein